MVKKPTKKPYFGRFDGVIKNTIDGLRDGGTAINKATFIGVVQGTLTASAPHTLITNGGHIDPASRGLRQSFYKRHNMVRRRKTSSRKSITDHERALLHEEFVETVNNDIEQFEIEDELVINFDETALPILPAESYTMNVRGGTNVRIVGAGDKRNITGVVGGSRAGDRIPWQLIYKGTTDRCHPDRNLFPPDWCITHSPNHWSTKATKLQYLIEIILEYVKGARERLSLARGDDYALVIFDYQTTNTRNPDFIAQLTQNRILWAIVPSGMTDTCQPMDQIVNRKIKSELKKKFTDYYASLLTKWLDEGNDATDFEFDSSWTALKRRHSMWLVSTYNAITADDIKRSFEICGLGGDEDLDMDGIGDTNSGGNDNEDFDSDADRRRNHNN